MPRLIDLSGLNFGRLTVLSRADENSAGGKPKWKCECNCGCFVEVDGSDLRSGHTKSCGCLRVEKSPANVRRTHGRTKTREYFSWKSMHQRCSNAKATGFGRYGARGIKVCDRWKDFANFLIDMGRRPPGHSLDRIDTNGDYEPDNCRWATPKQQQENRRYKWLAEVISDV